MCVMYAINVTPNNSGLSVKIKAFVPHKTIETKVKFHSLQLQILLCKNNKMH